MTKKLKLIGLWSTICIALVVVFMLLGNVFSEKVPQASTGGQEETDIFYRDKVLFLVYHHIAEKEQGITISPERFESHMQELERSPYQVISMDTYLKFVDGEGNIPPNAVVITFDDGYESFYQYAFPILQKYRFSASHFIIGHLVGETLYNTPYMTWDQMKEMKQAGMGFYSHTYDLHREVMTASGSKKPALTHRIWFEEKQREETDEEYRDRIKKDLQMNERLLQQHLGEQPALLCFPYGAFNETVLDIGREVGITRFFLIEEGIAGQEDEQVPRLNAGQSWIDGRKLIDMMNKLHHTTAK